MPNAALNLETSSRVERRAHDSYWQHRLAGLTPQPGFLADFFESGGERRWAAVRAPVSPKSRAVFRRLHGGRDLSAFIVFLGGVQVFLQKQISLDDVLALSPALQRWSAPEGSLLPLRSPARSQDNFRSFLQRVRRTVVEAYAHQQFPVECPEAAGQIMTRSSRIHNFISPARHVNLIFEQVESGGEEQFVICYDLNCYQPQCMDFVADQWGWLMDQLLGNPDVELSRLDLLRATERQKVLEYGRSLVRVAGATGTLDQLIAASELQHGDKVAVIHGSDRRTYRQLGERSRCLAQLLHRRGLATEQFVGVFLERGVAYVEAVLGLLQAGGTYVPLDPSYPRIHIEYMIKDSGMKVLITRTELAQRLSSELLDQFETVFFVDGGQSTASTNKYCGWSHADTASAPIGEQSVSRDTGRPAYLLYTSGSTGMPKGSLISHAGAVNHIHAEAVDLGLDANICFLQSAPSSSDISVWQLLGPLVMGGCTVIVDENTLCDPRQLFQLIRREKITLIEVVPGVLRALLDHANDAPDREQDLATLRCVMVTGDAVSVPVVNQWLAVFPQIRLVNAYGPTEAADDVCQAHLLQPLPPALRRVPIGRPIANMKVYVLDAKLQLRPVAAPGEICIAGVGVGAGYWKQEQRTRASFAENPYCDEARDAVLYRTGDWGRWLPDGNLEFIGRIDHQVKVRGFRIELSEVEHGMAQCDSVTEVAATVYDQGDGKQLVGYVVLKAGRTVEEFSGQLREKLPGHMIPRIRVLNRLPRLPSGKVNRKDLPAPEAPSEHRTESGQAPRSETERLLAKIWAEVLRVPSVGIEENFFALGGDSILSIQMISRATRAGIRLVPKQIFAHQTIAELAAAVQNNGETTAEQGILVGEVPLAPVQHWFFEQPGGDLHHYNQSVLLKVGQEFDSALVERCVHELVFHHDSLRLRFEPGQSGWSQSYAAFEANAVFAERDFSSVQLPEWGEAVSQEAAELQATLNLTTGPLIRVVWFRPPPTELPRLLIVIHHLAVDGVSWRILLEDLQSGCEALRRGAKPSFGMKTSSWRAWANSLIAQVKQPEVEAEIPYWKEILTENSTQLPADFPDGLNQADSARRLTVTLTPEETRILTQVIPGKYQTSVHDVLLTALALALRRWTGCNSTLVDLEGHGRGDLFSDLDTSRTTGWFTAIYPVALSVGEKGTFIDELKSLQERLRRIPRNGFHFGALRYLRNAFRDVRFTSPQITFNYLGQFDQVLNPDGGFMPAPESIGPWENPKRIRSYWLDVNGSVGGGIFGMTWEYSANIHRAATVQQLADEFILRVREFVAEAAAAAGDGRAVSDFALINLSPDEIETVLEKAEFK